MAGMVVQIILLIFTSTFYPRDPSSCVRLVIRPDVDKFNQTIATLNKFCFRMRKELIFDLLSTRPHESTLLCGRNTALLQHMGQCGNGSVLLVRSPSLLSSEGCVLFPCQTWYPLELWKLSSTLAEFCNLNVMRKWTRMLLCISVWYISTRFHFSITREISHSLQH